VKEKLPTKKTTRKGAVKATSKKQTGVPPVPKPVDAKTSPTRSGHVSVEINKGRVSVSRDDVSFTIAGKNVKLKKRSPLSLAFDYGAVEYRDGEMELKAEGDSVKLELDS